MKVIIIESTAYKVTNRQYDEIRKKEFELDIRSDSQEHDDEMMEYLDQNIHLYRIVGPIDFDFRL